MFQCSHGFYDELLGLIANPPPSTNISTPTPKFSRDKRDEQKSRYFPASTHDVKREVGSPTSASALSFMLDWLNLLNEYRNRDLTYGQDRIIAFAGIARAFANFGALTYLAGAWKEVLPLSLLWNVLKKPDAITTPYTGHNPPVQVKEEVNSSGIPSWSPFSLPIYTHHQLSFLIDSHELYARGQDQRPAGAPQKQKVLFNDIYCAEALAFHFPGQPANTFPKDTSGFHIFEDLALTLTLPHISTSTFRPADVLAQIKSFPAAVDSHVSLDFEYFPDTPDAQGSQANPPRHSVLALLCETQICFAESERGVQRRLTGLMLGPSKRRRGAWARVGAWKLVVKVGGVRVDKESMGRVAERGKGVRIVGTKWGVGDLTLV
jgi:hypothetical protein